MKKYVKPQLVKKIVIGLSILFLLVMPIIISIPIIVILALTYVIKRWHTQIMNFMSPIYAAIKSAFSKAVNIFKPLVAPLFKPLIEYRQKLKINATKNPNNPIVGCLVWILIESILVLVTLIILGCIPKEVCYVQLLVDSGLYFFLFPIYIVIPLFVSFILRAEWAIRKSGILGWRKCLLVTLVIWSIFIAIDLIVMNSMSKKYRKDFNENRKEEGRSLQREVYRSF